MGDARSRAMAGERKKETIKTKRQFKDDKNSLLAYDGQTGAIESPMMTSCPFRIKPPPYQNLTTSPKWKI